MTLRLAIAAALAGATLLLSPAAAQAACNLNAAAVPVDMNGLRPLVTVKVNGQEVQFLLDSGAFYNSIDAKLAAQQKLKPAPAQTTGTHFAAAGATLTTGAGGADKVAAVVIAPRFEFAGQTYSNQPFLTLTGFGDAAGILGQNFLHQVDVEYDLSGGVMRLIKPQGCGAVDLAYWAKPGTTYSVMPLEPTGGFNLHTVGMIAINGVRMRAYFDTGAATSFITARAAERAGVKTTDPAARYVGFSQGIDRGDIKTWIAPFSSIKIGDEEIKNTQLEIGESDALDFDVLIGADFFLAHHVYVANSQGKLYFTYSGGPVFNVGSLASAAASRNVPPEANAYSQTPTSAQFLRYYPEQAMNAGKEGRASIRCAVADDGTARDCSVLSEDPEGWGFGAAALRLAPLFRLKPGAKPGGAITIPINFRLAG